VGRKGEGEEEEEGLVELIRQTLFLELCVPRCWRLIAFLHLAKHSRAHAESSCSSLSLHNQHRHRGDEARHQTLPSLTFRQADCERDRSFDLVATLGDPD